ncbi:MAG: hypothetical protein IJ651_02075 [Bacteroidales bacterium]|nr:hypothetical protein [Bacteroidales bacterium]
MKKALLIATRFLLAFLVGMGATSCVRTEYVDNPIPATGHHPSNAETSRLEFPEGSSLDVGDISLYGDGQTIQVAPDGSFDTDASTLLATNGDNIVYWSYTIPTIPTTLNSLETAISLLMPALPFTTTGLTMDQLWIYKMLIGRIDETRKLADAIDKSLIQHGYILIDEIQPSIKAATDSFYKKLGLDFSQKSPSRRVSSGNFPYFTLTGTNEANAEGFYIKMKDSKLGSDSNGNFIECTFRLLNADRYCYTSIVKGIKTGDNHFTRQDFSFSDTFTYPIPPMNISAKMDFGLLSDIVLDPVHFMNYLTDLEEYKKLGRVIEQLWEPLRNGVLCLLDKPTEVTTYDKIEVDNIKFRFYSKNEHLLIVGPGNDYFLKCYGALRIALCPLMNLAIDILDSPSSQGREKVFDNVVKDFLLWMMFEKDDDVMITSLATLFDTDLTWPQRLNVWPDLAQYFFMFIKDGLVHHVFDRLGAKIIESSLDIAAFVNCMKAVKAVLVGGDLIMLMLDNDYEGFAFELTQNFFDANGWVDNIPGNEIN